ncbi:hypothetical protein LJR074_002581 [Acidovorax sp. LjRoot74]|uniref:hypothetical protein n=1 Tax=Acidovorax sp. LjRoot74 TaxID=3342337 RepID=UPI003ECF06C2
MSDAQNAPCAGAAELPCFTPLTTKVGMAAAKAVGIDPGKVVDVNFEFGPPGHAYVVARYPLDDAAMARVLEALAAIPVAGQPGAVPTTTDVFAELRAIRLLLEGLSDGGVAIRTRSANS